MRLSVVIPLYDEEDNVEPLAMRMRAAMDDLGSAYQVETILVDDGSRDRTGQILDRVAAGDRRLKVVHLRRNFGQTAAIMAGIDHAAGEVIVTMDGDLQNDPGDIRLLLDELAKGYDVVSGWRRRRRDPWLTRVLPSRIANRLISLLSGVRLHDYGCTLKAYRREVIAGVKLYGEMHRFIPIYATWQGARVTEVTVEHHPRKRGKSKYGLERTVKVILDLMVVKFLGGYAQKPIYVFGGFALLNLLLSLAGFLLMLYYKFWGGKSFVETPLPQLVVIFFLVGVMSMLMGLLAELIMRTWYESQGKSVYLVQGTTNLDPPAATASPSAPRPEALSSRPDSGDTTPRA